MPLPDKVLNFAVVVMPVQFTGRLWLEMFLSGRGNQEVLVQTRDAPRTRRIACFVLHARRGAAPQRR